MTAQPSATPLARKLGIRPGAAVVLVGAPEGWSIPELPDGVTVARALTGAADVVLRFVRRRAEVGEGLDDLGAAIRPAGSLWIAWPRRAGGHDSDVTEQGLRAEILPTGLVDTKVAALDPDWSGLRFVWRRELR